jgi:hypothetical protein
MERDWAFEAADDRASDAHLRLSALHLSRALILEEVDRRMGEPRLVPITHKASVA